MTPDGGGHTDGGLDSGTTSTDCGSGFLRL
jgi:hypothetical protein